VLRVKSPRDFIKRFLMHYGICRRYPLGQFPALRNGGIRPALRANEHSFPEFDVNAQLNGSAGRSYPAAQPPFNQSAAPSARNPAGILPASLSEETVAAVTESILNSLRNATRKLLRRGYGLGHVREAAAPPLEMVEVPSMSHFLLTFGDPSRPPFAAAIIEAPSIAQARMTAVVRRLAPGLPFGEGIKLNDGMMTLILPHQIGRTLSGEEATQLILQLAEPRRKEANTASA
jgi:hypothetical protein